MAGKKSRALDPPDIDGEPEGWRQLQELARIEKDPKKLAAIIDKMNDLLTECEKQASATNGRRPTTRRTSAKKNR